MEIEIRNAEALGECYEIINQQRLEIERLRAAAQSLLKWMKDDPGGWYSEDCQRIWNDLEAALKGG